MVKLSRMDCAVPVECTAADLPLATWLELLGPGGELHLHMSPAMTPGFSIPLLLAGYVDLELVDSGKGGNTVVTAYKPKWKTGAFAKVAHEMRHVERVVESTAMDDEYAAEDDDLIDENGLLGADVVEFEHNRTDASDCSTKRRACAGCSCGRVEREALDDAGAGQQPHVDIAPTSAESACGNCYKGDAFRCSSCPHRGKPTFKPGQETIMLDLKDDF